MDIRRIRDIMMEASESIKLESGLTVETSFCKRYFGESLRISFHKHFFEENSSEMTVIEFDNPDYLEEMIAKVSYHLLDNSSSSYEVKPEEAAEILENVSAEFGLVVEI